MKGTLYQRFQEIRSIPWGGSTNIQATFELILRKAKHANLSQEDMPKRIIIISDMHSTSQRDTVITKQTLKELTINTKKVDTHVLS